MMYGNYALGKVLFSNTASVKGSFSTLPRFNASMSLFLSIIQNTGAWNMTDPQPHNIRNYLNLIIHWKPVLEVRGQLKFDVPHVW